MDSPDSIHCSQCKRVVLTPKKHQGMLKSVSLSSSMILLSKCSKCQRVFCHQCLQREFLCPTCLDEIPAGKYRFLKKTVVEWQRKVLKPHLKRFWLFRVIPALIWFLLFMIFANFVPGSLFMLYATIAYVPIFIISFQFVLNAYKLLAPRIIGRLLFQKMLISPVTEEILAQFPTSEMDYLRTFKWKDFSKASEPLEYFLHSAEIDSEKKYKK